MKRGRRQLTGPDYLVLLISFVIVVAASVLLFLELRRSSSHSGEKAIGEITYRNRVAQRRDQGLVIWSDLSSGDAVFDGDSVRTGEAAEALIELSDGSKIELDPESLIVLTLREKAGVQLLKGSMIVHPGKQGASLTYNDRNYQVEGESLRIVGDETSAEAEAGEGTVLRTSDGTVVLRSRESAELRNRSEKRVTHEIRSLQPLDNARFFVAPGGRVDVDFQWSPEEGEATVELQQGTVRSLTATGGKMTLALGEGSYFWRVRRGKETSPLRRLRVREKEAPLLLQPAPDATFLSSGEKQTVAFRWKEHELASSYYFEVARDQGFSDRVIYETVLRTGISVSLTPGIYYWRILVRGALPGAEAESAARSFTIMKASGSEGNSGEARAKEKDAADERPTNDSANKTNETRGAEEPSVKKNALPARPVLLYPAPGTVVDMTGSNVLLFRWTGDPTVERALTLREGRTGRIVFQTRVRGNSYSLADLTVLDTGPFEWAIEEAGTPIRARFTIILREALEKPKLEIH